MAACQSSGCTMGQLPNSLLGLSESSAGVGRAAFQCWLKWMAAVAAECRWPATVSLCWSLITGKRQSWSTLAQPPQPALALDHATRKVAKHLTEAASTLGCCFCCFCCPACLIVHSAGLPPKSRLCWRKESSSAAPLQKTHLLGPAVSVGAAHEVAALRRHRPTQRLPWPAAPCLTLVAATIMNRSARAEVKRRTCLLSVSGGPPQCRSHLKGPVTRGPHAAWPLVLICGTGGTGCHFSQCRTVHSG